MKNNFKRSNVNESTLEISSINRSGFDLSHRNDLDIRLGKLYPVNFEQLVAGDTIKGSLSPKLQFEKIVTPTIGRTRLDTHTFVVHLRRINRDFKQFIEDSTNQSVLPSFDYKSLVSKFLTDVLLIKASVTIHDFQDELTNAGITTISAFSAHVLDNLNTLFSSLSDNGYVKDWFVEYINYIKAFQTTLTVLDIEYFFEFAYYALQPLFGPGSLLDFLGYPVFSIYDRNYTLLIRCSGVSGVVGTSTRFIDLLFNDGIVDNGDHTFNITPSTYSTTYSEMPLRAVYAIYYDYFRDWHVEKRSQVLDPDLFGSSSLITIAVNQGGFTRDLAGNNVLLQLLRLPTRYFSRDFLNTVQTEDIFRHVYSPVFADSDTLDDPSISSPTYSYSNTGYSNVNFTADFITGIFNLSDGSSIPMLGGLASSFSQSTDVALYVQDLQTMRRANMLEKWLARNYFYPDNYVGQIMAHYGVKPEDAHIQLSNFIGGSEKMVAGEQHVASTSGTATSGDSSLATPAGTRTMVAGVDVSDSFSYTATDHCYIISMISLVPLVNYDVKNPFIECLRPLDIPTHEYANDSRCLIRTKDLLRGFDNNNDLLGYVPRYYAYRVHGDETHGSYLTDKRSYNWFRDWYNMVMSSDVRVTLDSHAFVLSPYSLRINLSPDAFLGLAPWDSVAFGSCDIQFFANRPLPAAVDFI